ncbi:MAG: hypothetical protein IJH40_10370 [Ruminococcus sp.]|uniref:hypothetical protein n=1 Tax=Ruminococcus sp. TaxID=41978 RepID=UPI002872D583|nr:hypothetical protein [Ruminococcus sp.]MBQ3286026.1 hypothetical protein [Ruminococcus sp.]
MKSKLSWITFIPLALLGCFLKLVQGFLPEGTLLGLSNLILEYLFLGCVALILIFTFIFTLADKKIAAYYLPHCNYPAGIFGLLSAILLAADGANTLFHSFSSGIVDVLSVISAVLALLSAIVFIVLGLNHSFRYKEGKQFSLLNVIPALFCAVRMILCFVTFTTISIRLADVSSLICYLFATLFFYNYALMLSLTKVKRAVKNCFVFGLPAAAVMVPYGIYRLMFAFNSEVILDNIQPLEITMFGLYILCVLIEISIFVRRQDEIEFVTDDVPRVDISDEKVEGFIASNQGEDDNDTEQVMDESVMESRDTDGFLYQEMQLEDEEPEDSEEKKADADSYLTEIAEEDDDQRPKDYEARLDDIDRLILEINEQSD